MQLREVQTNEGSSEGDGVAGATETGPGPRRRESKEARGGDFGLVPQGMSARCAIEY